MPGYFGRVWLLVGIGEHQVHDQLVDKDLIQEGFDFVAYSPGKNGRRRCKYRCQCCAGIGATTVAATASCRHQRRTLRCGPPHPWAQLKHVLCSWQRSSFREFSSRVHCIVLRCHGKRRIESIHPSIQQSIQQSIHPTIHPSSAKRSGCKADVTDSWNFCVIISLPTAKRM